MKPLYSLNKISFFKSAASSLILAAILCAASIGHAQASAGIQTSATGGGGINRNGRYMTFYTAGFYTEPVEASPEEVPQLQELIKFFNTTPYMSEITKVKYASKLVPSSVRMYFKVKQDTFTPEIRKRLVAEYSSKMSIDAQQIALFAVTDTTSNTTYLFPEFYTLKPTEQQAILFHQVYLINNPSAHYSEVLQAEMAFQAYIEYPYSPDRLLRWIKTSGNTGDAITAAIRTDIQNRTMNGLIQNGYQINIGQLLGAQFFACKTRGLGSECAAFISTNVYNLSQQYPKSLFVKLFADATNRNAVYLLSSGVTLATFLREPGYHRSYDFINTTGEANFWSNLAASSVDLSGGLYSGRTDFPIDLKRDGSAHLIFN